MHVVEELVYLIGVDHIIAIFILQQSSSALLWSRRLFVASLLWCGVVVSMIGITLFSWSQCIRAVLEQITREAPIYP